jgi:hypothetical protein
MAMFATKYKVKVMTYTGRRPSTSAASPTSVGAIVATAMYDVTVKFIWSIETDSALDIEGIAG